MGRRLAVVKQRYPQPINEESAKVIRIKFDAHPRARTPAQEYYLESLRESPLTIGTGPAGSGKSFLAVAVALEKLLANEVSKIVLTRPAVESGPSMGFLPGDLDSKIAPYLRPLLDAIGELVGPTMCKKLLDSEKIEFAPLSYLRGRTFNNSFVILDEGQNTTPSEMKLFVTRAGNFSTFVVNGDVTQCDLRINENGLDWLVRRIRGRSSMINVIEFGHNDVQRSPLVKELLIHLDGPDDK